MKRFIIGAAIVATGILAVAPAAFSTQDEDLHCPAGGVKVEVNDDNDSESDNQDVVNALVLDEGTRVCVKASNGNTDIVEADGEDTLQEILFDNGIVDGSGEQGRDVSYYVVYPPLLEAFICFEGDIVVLTNEVQAALNIAVAAYLAANPGAVQVESEDAVCNVPVTTTTVPPTTTTTIPPTTTTTAPPVVTTTAPPVPVATPNPVDVTTSTACEDIGTFTHCPGQPHGGPSELPKTGAGSWLFWVGLGLLVSGLAAWGLGSRLRGRSIAEDANL